MGVLLKIGTQDIRPVWSQDKTTSEETASTPREQEEQHIDYRNT